VQRLTQLGARGPERTTGVAVSAGAALVDASSATTDGPPRGVGASRLAGGAARTGHDSSVHWLDPCRTFAVEQPCRQLYRSVPGPLSEQPAATDHGDGTTMSDRRDDFRRAGLGAKRGHDGSATVPAWRWPPASAGGLMVAGGAPLRTAGVRGSGRSPASSRRAEGRARVLRRPPRRGSRHRRVGTAQPAYSRRSRGVRP
jgi:hypothetical protein